jgi:hypothetical protein
MQNSTAKVPWISKYTDSTKTVRNLPDRVES